MEIVFSRDGIRLGKVLNALDQFVLDFTTLLDIARIRYVIVSGYVAILFGRNRTSEDIDLIIEDMDKEQFQRFWDAVDRQFSCIITSKSSEAYDSYLHSGHAIRFARKEGFIPNIEIKFPQNELDHWALTERKRVILNGHPLAISPLELQIAFKLFLGSEKDIEDARYLYRLFKDHLDTTLLQQSLHKLKIPEHAQKYLS